MGIVSMAHDGIAPLGILSANTPCPKSENASAFAAMSEAFSAISAWKKRVARPIESGVPL